MNCLECQKETKNPKFCSNSCSAKFNNRGVRRHGNGPKKCLICDTMVPFTNKFCSKKCFSIAHNQGDEHRKRMNALRQSHYRTKKLRVLDPTADKEKIKQIYLNCPVGHEVDHIIPLSKGGKHHENNLQYLTIEENRKKGDRLVSL